MPLGRAESGGGAWRQWAVTMGSEVLGTALLVALGCASLQPGHVLSHPALAFGAAVAWLVDALAPVSGAHLNPAVSLASLLAGRLAPYRAAAYFLAQCAGAMLGFGALVTLGVAPAPIGCTVPAKHVSSVAAAAVEALLTGALAAHCLALWVRHDPRRPDTGAPLKLGFTVAGLVYSGVYWVGPLGGAAVATLLYRAGVLLAPPAPAPAAAETLPLTDAGSGKREPCC